MGLLCANPGPGQHWAAQSDSAHTCFNEDLEHTDSMDDGMAGTKKVLWRLDAAELPAKAIS